MEYANMDEPVANQAYILFPKQRIFVTEKRSAIKQQYPMLYGKTLVCRINIGLKDCLPLWLRLVHGLILPVIL